MYSSRKSSVRRHIKNIHNGDGLLVPFIEYMVGRKMGYYLPPLPSLPPAYESKKQTNGIDYLNLWKEEFLRGVIRKRLQFSQ